MKTLSILKNRYFYSAIILIFTLLIIDDTTIFKLFKMKNELKSLKIENRKKIKEISLIKEKTKQLTTSKIALEKFAREHYLMKKKDEVIYVFEDL
ncbi:MAG: septum formation initiator family protein [Flavobacteriales bacterium]|nr:septum formation initiator family protein [Flavobacteriales bacterium]MDG1439697.1 septum formation initiator family protein [Flavobacteriales bacterium]MDG1797328.1 septum formation initiator family protein [Flavobacteriales bacterium]